MRYYLIYRQERGWEANEAPQGIIAHHRGLGPTMEYHYHAMTWNHSVGAWTYDPETAARILSEAYWAPRLREVDRTEAERLTPLITNGEMLPDEDQISWLFKVKGNPPASP